MNCINLPEFRVIKAEENEFDYRFTVETIEEPDFCPQCFYTTDCGIFLVDKYGRKKEAV